MKWELPKWLQFRSSELYIPAQEESRESKRKTKMQREIDECPVVEPFNGHVTPEASPNNIHFETVEPLLSDMTPQHQPSHAGFELYTFDTGNEMPGVEDRDLKEIDMKREGRARKKPRLIKVANLNRSPSPEEVTVSLCSTSTVKKLPPIRAIKQVRSPEKNEETSTHKKPMLIEVATRNRSPSPGKEIVPPCLTSTVKKRPRVRAINEERSHEKHEERMTRKKQRLTKEAAPPQSPSPKVEILSPYPIHCAQERKSKISPPPFTKIYAWMEPTSVEVTESAVHTEVTHTVVHDYSNPPATVREDEEESEDENEVEILPWVERMKQGQTKKIINYTSPPSKPKSVWMEKESDPKIKDAEVVVVEESKTEVKECVSTPSASERHDSRDTLNIPITQRQKSFLILPPIPKGLPLPDKRQYLQRQDNTQKPATNANRNQQPVLNILTLKEWRDSRKKLKKEQKAKKQQKQQLECDLMERYFNDPRMQHLLVNRHNRFNQQR